MEVKLATFNLEGEEEGRAGWAYGLGTGLSAGGLLAASCQKQGEEGGVLYWHPQLTRL